MRAIVFDGVGQDVQQHLLYVQRAAQQAGVFQLQAGGSADDLHARFLGTHVGQGLHFLQQGGQVEHLLRQRNIPFFQLAQLQRIVDQRHQVAGCHAGLSAAGIDQLPVIRVLAANFQQTNDAIEQRAHIIGQPGREIRPRPVGLLHIFQFFHAAQGFPQEIHGGRQFFR